MQPFVNRVLKGLLGYGYCMFIKPFMTHNQGVAGSCPAGPTTEKGVSRN
jgi:hypothetical protein